MRASLPTPAKSPQARTISLSLGAQAPVDFRQLLVYYRNHTIDGLETATDDIYERIFQIDGQPGILRARQGRTTSQLAVTLKGVSPDHAVTIGNKLRRMFDLALDPAPIAAAFKRHKFLAKLWKAQPALRLAGAWDPFEMAIRTILGQLVSVKQGRALVGQLVAAHGEEIAHPVTGRPIRLFPSAVTLVSADLTAVRTSNARKETIRNFSRAILDGKIVFNDSRASPTREELLALPGIGPWSADYIRLRAMGDPDAFPRTDLLLKRAVQKHPDLLLDDLKPWRSYAAIYLWHHYSSYSEG